MFAADATGYGCSIVRDVSGGPIFNGGCRSGEEAVGLGHEERQCGTYNEALFSGCF